MLFSNFFSLPFELPLGCAKRRRSTLEDTCVMYAKNIREKNPLGKYSSICRARCLYYTVPWSRTNLIFTLAQRYAHTSFSIIHTLDAILLCLGGPMIAEVSSGGTQKRKWRYSILQTTSMVTPPHNSSYFQTRENVTLTEF